MNIYGKRKQDRLKTNGSRLKDVFLEWFERSGDYTGIQFSNLEHSLLFLQISNEEYFCSITTCDSSRDNKNFTVGKEKAETYMDGKYKDSWLAIFVVMSNHEAMEVIVCTDSKLMTTADEGGILTKNRRSKGSGYYYKCDYKKLTEEMVCTRKVMPFSSWYDEVNLENV